MPFTQLTMHPTGLITPCCYLHDFELGNVRDKKSLYDAFDSPLLKKLRDEHLSGCSSTCAKNIKNKNCNLRNDHFFKESYLKDPQIKRLDLRLNGKCNIECIMCTEWQKPNNLYDQTDFFERGEKDIFPFIEDVYFGGGEPLIQPVVYKIINRILELNPKCSFSINTNGQYKLTDFQLDLFKKMNLENLYLSIDSLKPHIFEKIRLKGNLEKLLINLQFFKKLKIVKEFNLFIAFVLQKDNYLELEDICSFCRKNGAYLVVHFLDKPEEFSVLELDQAVKDSLLKKAQELKLIYPEFSSGLNRVILGISAEN